MLKLVVAKTGILAWGLSLSQGGSKLRLDNLYRCLIGI